MKFVEPGHDDTVWFFGSALTTPQTMICSHLKNVICSPYWRLDFRLCFDSRGTLLIWMGKKQ
jgi:hypothetical protein